MLRCLVLASLIACSLGAATLSRRPRLDGRIADGELAIIEDYPHQISLEYKNRHICGGAIISASWVVTAGNCVDRVPPSQVGIRAGSSYRETGGTLHPASYIVLNPQYDYYTLDFDVAVIRVSPAFNMGREVQPIPLTTSELEAGEVGRVSGWGTLSKDNETLPLQLHYAIGVTVSREECNKAYEKFGGITENMICAAFLNMGPCFGDSGDALSVDHILIGIVSWSFECGESTHPTVYSNVAVLRSFITEETGVN